MNCRQLGQAIYLTVNPDVLHFTGNIQEVVSGARLRIGILLKEENFVVLRNCQAKCWLVTIDGKDRCARFKEGRIPIFRPIARVMHVPGQLKLYLSELGSEVCLGQPLRLPGPDLQVGNPIEFDERNPTDNSV
jgi:hypothetical protein